MKIAYIICVNHSVSLFNGIRMQANEWANELIQQGHQVDRINPWNNIVWESYDIIHIFGQVDFLYHFCTSIQKRNKNIVLSPIIDTIKGKSAYKLISYIGCKKLRLFSVNYQVRLSAKYIKEFIVRSKYEYEYVHKCYSVPSSKIHIIPLSFKVPQTSSTIPKENFCLHVSIITDERKNVRRLCLAAEKYKFKLVLAGSISSEHDFKPIKEIIDRNDNISYIGRISDRELLECYSRAKVFALPSINEGVGLVALEAAVNRCEIVITKLGGPKEYYANKAYLVDPYNIDDIGTKILRAMKLNEYQPSLSQYVYTNYNLTTCVKKLVKAYEQCL